MKTDKSLLSMDKIVSALILTLISLFMLAISSSSIVSAQSGSGRDCDNNAVLRCGSLTVSELKQKYRSSSDAKYMFSHMGISSTEVMQMDSTTTKKGFVTRDGRVIVDGKTVATDAMTVGRQNMPGSRAVKKGGTTFYTRPPSASFQQERLDALVTMKNDRFQHAVITSCGNPVKATPVKPKPQPTPEQTPPPVTPVAAEQPQPPAPPQQTQVQVQTTEVNQQTVVKNTAPPEQERPAPPPQPQPQPQKELPDTGPGTVAAGASALVTVASTIGYAVYARLRSILL